MGIPYRMESEARRVFPAFFPNARAGLSRRYAAIRAALALRKIIITLSKWWFGNAKRRKLPTHLLQVQVSVVYCLMYLLTTSKCVVCIGSRDPDSAPRLQTQAERENVFLCIFFGTLSMFQVVSSMFLTCNCCKAVVSGLEDRVRQLCHFCSQVCFKRPVAKNYDEDDLVWKQFPSPNIIGIVKNTHIHVVTRLSSRYEMPVGSFSSVIEMLIHARRSVP